MIKTLIATHTVVSSTGNKLNNIINFSMYRYEYLKHNEVMFIYNITKKSYG